ncbi:MAG: hypothetical protein PHE84_13220 [bacterium]|nr:hypothetical protein [bacterium]
MPARNAAEFPWGVFITGVSVMVVIVFGFLMYFLRNVGELEESERQDNLLKGQANTGPPDDPESKSSARLLPWLIIIGIIAAFCFIWIRKIAS